MIRLLSNLCVATLILSSLSYGQNTSGTARGVSFNMVRVDKGSFQMGCPTSNSACGSTERDQHKVNLTYDYYISEHQVTEALWRAVMTDSSVGTSKKPKTGITWYDAVTFTCKLSQQTGKKYRLATEAEWEFAARGGTKTKNYAYSGSNTVGDVAWTKDNVPQQCYGNQCFSGGAQNVGGKTANELGLYDMSGNVYEWTFDNWTASFNSAEVTDPLVPHRHTQKVRRGGSAGQPAEESRVSGRKIRSIEGKDGEIGIRLALSVADSRPTGMDDPCDIHQPPPTRGKIGLRDERLITGNDEAWVYDMSQYMEGMAWVLKIWENGTARLAQTMIYNGQPMTINDVSGEWYTLNSFALHIVGSSSSTKYAYYLVSSTDLSIINENGMNSGPVGRFERMPTSSFPAAARVTAPTNISNPRTAEQLAPANATANLNIMANPPTNEQDTRLVEGTANGWWQNNASAGGTHHYRKDFNDKTNYMRFVVYDTGARTSIVLAEGEWFTVGNTFLRVKGCPSSPNTCYNYDYLYTVSSDGKNFSHISFQEYEPGDFRMFAKTPNSDIVGWFDPTGFYYQGHSTYLYPTAEGQQLPSSSSGGNGSSSSSSDNTVSPIRVPQITTGPLFGYATGKTIVLGNVPKGAKIDVYNLRGELISSKSFNKANQSSEFIEVQAKGIYFIKVNSQALRIPVM